MGRIHHCAARQPKRIDHKSFYGDRGAQLFEAICAPPGLPPVRRASLFVGDTAPESLPAFLRLFQSTPWNGTESLPQSLLDQIRERTIVASEDAVLEEGKSPFVGLDAFKIDQARLFFGRQKETLDALACFEDLPRLVGLRNRLGKAWTLPPIGEDGLREIVDGPARLARLDVSEVREAMIDQARDEPGALALVENALDWLWENREDSRLSGRRFNEQGGLAGILSRSADDLLDSLGGEEARKRALEVLSCLVRVDPEGRRHTRARTPLAEAVEVAGGDEEASIDQTNERMCVRWRFPHGFSQPASASLGVLPAASEAAV